MVLTGPLKVTPDIAADVEVSKRRQLERDFRSFVAIGSNLLTTLVLPGNDDGPAPQDLYATVLLIDDQKMFQSIYSEHDNILYQRDARRAFFSVQFYRAGAMDAADRFAAWGESEVALDEAQKRHFTLWKLMPIRRIDRIITSANQERAGIDALVDYWCDTRHDPGIAEHVPIQIYGRPQITIEGDMA